MSDNLEFEKQVSCLNLNLNFKHDQFKILSKS